MSDELLPMGPYLGHAPVFDPDDTGTPCPGGGRLVPHWATRISYVREEGGVTAQQFALEWGLSLSHATRWLSRHCVPVRKRRIGKGAARVWYPKEWT